MNEDAIRKAVDSAVGNLEPPPLTSEVVRLTGRRRVGFVAGMGFLITALIVGVSVWAASPMDSPRKDATPPTGGWSPDGTERSDPADRTYGSYKPQPTEQSGTKVLRLVFPEGTGANLMYPADLALEQIGVRPQMRATLNVGAGTGCSTVLLGSFESESPFHPDGVPIATYPAQQGNAELWAGYPDDPYGGRFLVFSFGPWKVGVPDRADGSCVGREELAQAWANGLKGETRDGFLALQADPSISLKSPELVFGDEELLVSVSLRTRECDIPGAERSGNTLFSRSRGFAYWCEEGGLVALRAETRDSSLLDRLVREVSARTRADDLFERDK